MNREQLLEAVGLLDDDLIQEAEAYRRPERNYRPWISLAACLAVVLALGYGVTHLGMGGGMSGGASQNAPSAGAPASSALTGDSTSGGDDLPPVNVPNGTENESQGGSGGDFQAPEAPGEPGAPDLAGGTLLVSVCLDGQWYRFTHTYDRDPVLEDLPEGCVSLGEVEQQGEDTAAPWTDGDGYLGCEVWLLPGEEFGQNLVYLELPEGGYLECRA